MLARIIDHRGQVGPTREEFEVGPRGLATVREIVYRAGGPTSMERWDHFREVGPCDLLTRNRVTRYRAIG